MQVRTNRLLLLALAGLSVATQAASLPLSADVSPLAWDSFTPQRTRAEVHAQAVAAVAAGRAVSPEYEREPAVVAISMKTGEQVHAEAVEALRLGLIAHGESGGPEAAGFQHQGQAGSHTVAARGKSR